MHPIIIHAVNTESDRWIFFQRGLVVPVVMQWDEKMRKQVCQSMRVSSKRKRMNDLPHLLHLLENVITAFAILWADCWFPNNSLSGPYLNVRRRVLQNNISQVHTYLNLFIFVVGIVRDNVQSIFFTVSSYNVTNLSYTFKYNFKISKPE